MPWAIIIVLGLLVLFWFIRRSYLICDLSAIKDMVQGSKINHIYVSSLFGRLRQVSFINTNKKTEVILSSKPPIKKQGEIVELTSPTVGTFHWNRSIKSGRTFGRLGKKVKEQQVVAVIENLGGLKNEVPSPADGEIIKVMIRNNQPVEYGQVLAIIEMKKDSLI